MHIGNRPVGPGHPCYIVAEAGVNHSGSIHTAKTLIRDAAWAGADAVKFQAFRTSNLVTKEAPKAEYQRSELNRDESQYEMLRRLELSRDALTSLNTFAHRISITLFCSVFDETSAAEVSRLNPPAYKIGSGELTNLPLLSHVSEYGKPMIVSTGMATAEECRHAVSAIRIQLKFRGLILLHCVSQYPARLEDCNFRAMETLAGMFRVPVGFSDHTPGLEAPIAAVAMGASLLEKHLKSRDNPQNPDDATSINVVQFKRMVDSIRALEKGMGNGVKLPTAEERQMALVARKSIVAARDIPAGTVMDKSWIVMKRPGTGIPPGRFFLLNWRRAKQDILQDTILEEGMFES